MALKNKNVKTIIRKEGIFYHPTFIKKEDKQGILDYLSSIYPIWEMRYSEHNPPPSGDEQRRLLRPVYWLGNWQFACLNYYHPPKGIHNRCVHAEDYPPVLKKLILIMEDITKRHFKKNEIPKGWHLNTCLINYYGSSIDENGKKTDCARVGDHKDFELGPVASLSLGERAFFQFVLGKKNLKDNIVYEQWLDDSSLLIFGGDLYKDRAFHRVQRVDNKIKTPINNLNVTSFETRRINFTFRYVPNEHIIDFKKLPDDLKSDVSGYVKELAVHSSFFREILEKENK